MAAQHLHMLCFRLQIRLHSGELLIKNILHPIDRSHIQEYILLQKIPMAGAVVLCFIIFL